MYSDDKRYGLIFNGEIVNYIEIKSKLIQMGKVFKTFSDTEVLLRAWEEWGDETLNVLEGMKNTLKQNHCCIYVETENKKVLQFMKDLGYSVKFMHHNLYREVRLVHSFATGGQGHIIATNFPLILRKQSWVESIIASLKKFI